VNAPSIDLAVLGLEADERMTAERVETKYLVKPERVPELLRELSAKLPAHRFSGEGANRLPDPHHYVTTVYFDTESRAHYRSSVANVEHNVKVRSKEYYDLHPSLAEIATDPTQIVRYQPWLWFELKRREGARTSKRRFRLEKRLVPEFFSGGQLIPEALAGQAGLPTPSLDELREVVGYCASLPEPLSASALVNYRRLSFQDRAGSLRVTVDLGLGFFAPPADLWTRKHALVRSTLGTPCGSLREAVLEVKRRAQTPAWLLDLLASAGQALPFSKFVAASVAVHGEARGR
jgi:hypothetical protein